MFYYVKSKIECSFSLETGEHERQYNVMTKQKNTAFPLIIHSDTKVLQN